MYLKLFLMCWKHHRFKKEERMYTEKDESFWKVVRKS